MTALDDLYHLPTEIKAAWHEAQAFPDRAAAILRDLKIKARDTHEQIENEIHDLRRQVEQAGLSATREIVRYEARTRTLLAELATATLADSLDPHGFYVYCLWGDSDARPLYVGQSSNLLGRLGSHLNDRRKRHLIKRVTLIKCTAYGHMMATEARLIAHYQPPLNTVGIDNELSPELRGLAAASGLDDLPERVAS